MHQQYNHEFWMARALKLAARGLYSTAPNPRVGCVIVRDGKLIAEGWHEYTGAPHAEVNAIQAAEIPPDSDFYINLEPCAHQGRTPACVDALIVLQPRRVVIAMLDSNPLVRGKGRAQLEAAGVEVICGVLEVQARTLNCGFVSRFERNRPFLRLKIAASMDGRTALKNGKSQWITSAAARADTQFLRARSSAILSTAATVAADDSALNVRLSASDLGQQVAVRQPVRVILDSRLDLTGTEKLFRQEGSIWIYTLNPDIRKHRSLEMAGAVITVFEGDEKQIDLQRLLTHLASREINEIHTECGQRLAGALIQQCLVDELVLYMAPKLLGSQARGLFELDEITQMSESLEYRIQQLRAIGEDIRITLTPE